MARRQGRILLSMREPSQIREALDAAWGIERPEFRPPLDEPVIIDGGQRTGRMRRRIVTALGGVVLATVGGFIASVIYGYLPWH